MAPDIRSAFVAIEAGIARLSRPTASLLAHGITRALAAPLATSRGLEPPPDLLSVWEWRNGTSAQSGVALGDTWLIPGFYLTSVQEATRTYDALVPNQRWDPTWLPFFADGGGDFFVVECSRQASKGSVRHFRAEESEHPVEYLTVERMFATIAEAFTRGVYFLDGDGYFEVDDAAYAALAAELNPEVGWWTDPLT